MSFNIEDLRKKGNYRVFTELGKAEGAKATADRIIKENNNYRLFESEKNKIDAFDIFLSHSMKDAEVILGILEMLKGLGYSVYVDWITDAHLDRTNVNKETIELLKQRMIQSKCLLYATTEHASQSKYMPWELGFMDGRKNKSAILPVFQSNASSSFSYKGQEYLGAYPYCIHAVFRDNPNKEGLWIFEDEKNYTLFNEWVSN